MPMGQGASFAKMEGRERASTALRTVSWPSVSMPWTWNTDFPMSRPIAVTFLIWLPPNRGYIIGNRILGASAPAEEAS
jgi:hypothetical protein